MPKNEGVYEDHQGGWYFKTWVGYDPLPGRANRVSEDSPLRPMRRGPDALSSTTSTRDGDRQLRWRP